MRAGRGYKPPKLAPFYAAIRAHVTERGDTTIEALRAWLLATHQVSASVGLILHTLKRPGLTLKNVWPELSARVISHHVLVSINVSGHRGVWAKCVSAARAPWISWVLRYLLPKSGLRVAQAPWAYEQTAKGPDKRCNE